MSVPVTWYDVEHSILVVTIYRGMTWADYHRCVDAVISEASQVNHRVDVIFDDNVGCLPAIPCHTSNKVSPK